MTWHWENHLNLKNAILIALLLHIMVFYFYSLNFNANPDLSTKNESIIRILNFRDSSKQASHKNIKRIADLLTIPAPIPKEAYTEPLSFDFNIEKSDLTIDHQFSSVGDAQFASRGNDKFVSWSSISGGDEFQAPEYDDFLIGVLGKNTKEGTRIYTPDIIYPESDISAYIQGKIVIKLTINKKGKVVSASILKGVGNTAIENAAKEAAMKCLYKPVTKNGEPVFFQDEWTINFKLK
jgi:TonB family protein